MTTPIDRRLFLMAAAGGAALSVQRPALARPAAGLDATAARSSPAAVRLAWPEAAGPAAVTVASAPYEGRGALRRVRLPAGGGDVEAAAAPRPYFQVETRSGRVWTAERLLPLKGGRNFRDLGGYRSADGRQVRWGRIYRSGVMSSLTFEDMDYLGRLGVGVICDLRSLDERKTDPSPFLKTAGAKVASFDYDLSSSLESLTKARTREGAVATFAAAYVGFLDTLTPNFRDMFAKLAAGDAPLTLNCSAGKDRTGMGSALILSVLGVPRETVVADYGLTQVYTPPAFYVQAMSQSTPTPGVTAQQAQALRQLPPDVLQVIMGADPEVMRQALGRIDADHGGPIGLVKRKFGLTDAGIARMRRLYLV
jgi:protein-tyrosine phosphatase